MQHHSRLDVLIYNSGAIWWAPVKATPTKRYQLMQRVNADGLYGAVQAALPHLEASTQGGRIVVVAPPIYSRFFRGKTAYAMGKVAMSVLVVGLGMDWEREGKVGRGMAVTGVWPAAVSFFLFPLVIVLVMMMMIRGLRLTKGAEHRVGGDGAVCQAGSGVQEGFAQGDDLFGCGVGNLEGPGGEDEWQVGAG